MARERKILNEINLRFLSICVALVCQFKTFETKSSVSSTLETLQVNYVRAWPFLAALYRTDQSKFFCGGTLISSRHILTAAHCVHEKYSDYTIQPDYITVLLGADDVASKIEVGARQREVKEVYIHPDWSVYRDSYDSDIAILFLSESVTFTKYIGPVCVPTGDDIVDGASGSTVGWELIDTEVKNDTSIYAVKSSRASYCPKTYPFSFVSSPHTFCGRSEDKNLSKVVSGGGFFIRFGTAWLQYGIDLAIPSNGTTNGDTKSVSFYTNVPDFSKWIANTVRKDGFRVTTMKELSKVKINFDCVYMDQPVKSEVYECWMFNVNVQTENVDVTSVTGNHLNDYINADVKLVRLINGTMLHIPGGMGKIFKNLQGIYVGSELGTKIIKRSNFKHMKSLHKLLFYPNDIESLDEDALWDLPILEDFLVVGNKLKVLPERLFEKNTELSNVDLRSNQLEYLPRNLFKNNLLLNRVDLHDNLLNSIEIDFTRLTVIREIWLYDNICISILYDIRNETSDDNVTYANQYRNLTEFQSLINTNCKSQVESKNSKFHLVIPIPIRLIYILGALFCSLIVSVVVVIRKKCKILNFCKRSPNDL